MNRGHALRCGIGAVFATCAPPLWAQLAAAGLRRRGVLVPSTRSKVELTLKPFFDQMRELGWTEGRNTAYDRVYADDRQQDLPRLAIERVARRPELITRRRRLQRRPRGRRRTRFRQVCGNEIQFT
jgi:hypothetical protein